MKKTFTFLFALVLSVMSVKSYAQTNGGAVNLPSDLTYLELAQVGADNEYRIRIASSSKGCVFRYTTLTVNADNPRSINGTWTLSRSSNNMNDDTNYMISSGGNDRNNPNGTIKFAYKRTDASTGWPIYDVTFNITCYVYANKWYYQTLTGTKELIVRSYKSTTISSDNIITLTDDGRIHIAATNIDPYIDNTGADAEWKYWLLAGTGIGSDNKQYTFTLKYNASTILDSEPSQADKEVISLYQNATKIDYSTVATTVTEYKTGKYNVTASFKGTDGKDYVVSADYIDECVATDGSTGGNTPTGSFTFENSTISTGRWGEYELNSSYWQWKRQDESCLDNGSENDILDHDFIRVTAYTNDLAVNNYVQLMFWTNDFSTTYQGKIGPKEGTYTVEMPIWWYGVQCYWMDYYQDWWYLPKEKLGKSVVGYDPNYSFGSWDYNNSQFNNYQPREASFIATFTTGFDGSIWTHDDHSCALEYGAKDFHGIPNGSEVVVARGSNDELCISVTYPDGGTISIGGEIAPSTPTYKLTTYVNGKGTVISSENECAYEQGATIVLTPVPDNDWTFTGWTGECSDQITENGDGTYTYTVPAKDCSVIANFEENAGYTLTWDFNGGITTSQDNEYTSGNVPEGESIVAPADPTLEGYQFDGWFNSVTNNVEMAEGGMMPTQMPNNDLTYTAQWSKMQYVLAWDVNEGDALTGDYTQGEVEWGTAIIAPDDPTKEGYQFVGWVSSITNEVETPLEMPSADLTYTAQWTANTYTVHFDSNHSEAADEMGDQTFTYDVEQALTANGFEWTGHTFQGWATEANGNVVYADQQTVSNLTTENNAIVNLYAVWSLDYVTVTFANPDGSELQSYQLSIGDVPAYEGTPVQENEGDEYNYFMYTFAGWIDGDNNSYGASDALPAVTGDITYTAQYNKNLFIVLQEDKDADYYTAFSDKYNGERATTVTLNRQFSQGKWATLCLPFNVNTALISALGMSNRVYEFKYTKGSETEGLTLYFSQAKKIEAGKGYIVNANATMAKKTSFVFPAVVINTEADINSGFDISNLEGYNSQGTVYLVGTLRTGLLLGSQTGSRYMGLKDNKIYYPNTAQGTSVRAYRGIFRNTEDAPVSRVRIVVEGEDGEMVDELEVVNGEIEDAATPKKVILNGILYIERNGELFDAQGKRLE